MTGTVATASLLRARGCLAPLLDAALSTSGDEAHWSHVVIDAARPLLPGAVDVSVQVIEHTAAMVPLAFRTYGMEDLAARARVAAFRAPAEAVRRSYYPSTPGHMFSDFLKVLPAMRSLRQHLDLVDMLGVMSHPAPGQVVGLSFRLDATHVLTRYEQHVLTSVRAAVEAGYAGLTAIGFTGVALSTNGRLLEGAAEPGALWRPLASGRYRLHRPPARGHYLLVENPPWVRPQRRLPLEEVQVLKLAALGVSGKEVAWRLGLTQGAVSRRLRCGLARLGLPHLSDGLHCLAGLLALSPRPPQVALTASERAVLRLVQQGLTNDAIAQRRGTSTRTVANQVAALLRKAGAPGRRALHLVDAA